MIRKVAVLGAGTMGAQIAGHVANAGLTVLLLDVSQEQVQAGLKALEKSSPAALFIPDKHFSPLGNSSLLTELLKHVRRQEQWVQTRPGAL